jgi:adenosylhomocysteine nucleosidase
MPVVPPHHPATLILIPLKEEAAPVRRRLAGRSDVRIQLIGIGARNAERAIREALAGGRPERVFTCGFAGGLNPELETGRVIYATEDAELSAALRQAKARSAVFLQTPRVVVTAAEKFELRSRTGADAVEMESATIQSVCHEHHVPCATVRAISDPATQDMPLDFNALANPDQSLNFGKLLAAIARSPGCIPALLRLQASCRLAAERLAETLAQVLPPPR